MCGERSPCFMNLPERRSERHQAKYYSTNSSDTYDMIDVGYSVENGRCHSQSLVSWALELI
jgi:hypothetical protein